MLVKRHLSVSGKLVALCGAFLVPIVVLGYIVIGGVWNSQYTIISILAIYLVTQSGEAVIFRFFILTIPAQWVWRKAKYLAQTEYEEYPAYVS